MTPPERAALMEALVEGRVTLGATPTTPADEAVTPVDPGQDVEDVEITIRGDLRTLLAALGEAGMLADTWHPVIPAHGPYLRVTGLAAGSDGFGARTIAFSDLMPETMRQAAGEDQTAP